MDSYFVIHVMLLKCADSAGSERGGREIESSDDCGIERFGIGVLNGHGRRLSWQ